MKILYKGTKDKSFREMVVPYDLHTMQELVGGYIETVTVSDDRLHEKACVICNEEGRLYGLDHNCVFLGIDFVGPILIVGIDGEEFSDCPWTANMANGGIDES